MSLMSVLSGADADPIFADVAEATGLAPETARHGLEAMYPAIASALTARIQDDPRLMSRVSGLLAEDSGAEDEAVVDGKAILVEIYGSQRAATAALKKTVPDLPTTALSKLGPIGAVAVAAAVQQQGSALTLTGALPAAGAGSGGIVETILSAIIKSAIQGALRQLTSSLTRATRTRRTGSTSTSKRKTRTKSSTRTKSKPKSKSTRSKTKSATTRTRKKASSTRRTSTSALEDILGGILGTTRK